MFGKKFLNKIISGESGVTLFEMLVVITIISVLSLLVVVVYTAGQGRYEVNSVAQQFAAELRNAQNMALASQQKPEGVPTGFGIYVSGGASDNYVVFYNKFNTPSNINGYDPSWSVVIKTVYLPKTVYIVTNILGNRSVFFKPPLPTTFFNNVSDPPPSSRSFWLQKGGTADSYHTDIGAVFKLVLVYLTGRIQID